MENDPNDHELERLFASARKAQLYKSDTEYGFETRVMARLRTTRAGQRPFLLWAWRLIPVFVSLIILLGIWIYESESHPPIDLSAITKIGDEETMVTAFLTGE